MCSSFEQAVGQNNFDRVKELLKQGEIDVKKAYYIDGAWNEPLRYVINKNALNLAKLFIEHGADLDKFYATKHGLFSVLMWAACENNIDILKYFVSKGADVNRKTDLGLTALHCAAKQNNPEVVRYLLSLHNIDCSIQTNLNQRASDITTNDLIRKLILKRKNENDHQKLETEIRDLELLEMDQKIDETGNEISMLDSRIKELHVKIEDGKREVEEKMSRKVALTTQLAEFKSEKEHKMSHKPTFVAFDEALLECPLCLELAYPPRKTWHCSNGHTICSKCKEHPTITHCPQCREPLTVVVRCLLVEKMLNEKVHRYSESLD